MRRTGRKRPFGADLGIEPRRRVLAGRFITFEGGEGAGKSTQARRLAERLRAAGRDVVLTREPGGAPLAERIRILLLDPAIPPHPALAEALLFYAARADHVAQTIAPALARGAWVICDRFADSTCVYQGLAGGVDLKAVEALDRLVFPAIRPSLTFILDLPPETGLLRGANRQSGKPPASLDPYESRDITFHAKIREGFLEIARAAPDRCRVIDASRDEEAVAAAVWAAVAAHATGEIS